MNKIDLSSAFEVVKDLKQEIERELAELILSQVNQSASFRDKTGRLRRNNKIKKSRLGDGLIVVNTDKKAPLIEYGHGIYNDGQRVGVAEAKPFYRPAVAKVRNMLGQIVIRKAKERGL